MLYVVALTAWTPKAGFPTTDTVNVLPSMSLMTMPGTTTVPLACRSLTIHLAHVFTLVPLYSVLSPTLTAVFSRALRPKHRPYHVRSLGFVCNVYAAQDAELAHAV